MPNEDFDIQIKVRLVDEVRSSVGTISASLDSVKTQLEGKVPKFAPVSPELADNLGKIKMTASEMAGVGEPRGVKMLSVAIGNLQRHAKGLPKIIDEAVASIKRLDRAVTPNIQALLKKAGPAGPTGVPPSLIPTIGTADEKRIMAAASKLYGPAMGQLVGLQAIAEQSTWAKKTVVKNAQALNAELGYSTKQITGGLKGAAQRVLLWGTAAVGIYGGLRMIRSMITATIELDNEMVQLQKVMSDTTNWDKLKASLFDVAQAFGYVITDITKIAKVWAQQGYETNDILRLTNITLEAMAALSVDSATATDYLTSVIRVWNIEIQDLGKNLSSLMKVQADFAIESEDLVMIITKIGAGVREAGDDMAFLAGVSTALRETTRKTSSVISTALKSMYARAFTKDVIIALEQLGIKTKINENTFRSFGDILKDLSITWTTLSDVQKRQIALLIGSMRYWSDFMALMNNFTIAEKATSTFYRAWDEGSKAAERQTKSLKNQLASLQSVFTELGTRLSTGVFVPIISVISSVGKSMSKLFSFLPSMGATLMAIGMAFKPVLSAFLGNFPAWQSFMGSIKLGQADILVGTQKMVTANGFLLRSLVGMTTPIRSLAGSIGLVDKSMTTAAGATLYFAKSLYFLKTSLIAVWGGFKNIFSAVARFAIWSLIITAVFKAVEALDSLYKKLFKAKEELILTGEALQKFLSLSKDIGEGIKIDPTRNIKNLEKLVSAIYEFQKPLPLVKTTWEDIAKIINSLPEPMRTELLKAYKDLETSVESQKSLWQDIQTMIALMENETLKDALEDYNKGFDDLNKRITQFSEMMAFLAEKQAGKGIEAFLKSLDKSDLDVFATKLEKIAELVGMKLPEDWEHFLMHMRSMGPQFMPDVVKVTKQLADQLLEIGKLSGTNLADALIYSFDNTIRGSKRIGEGLDEVFRIGAESMHSTILDAAVPKYQEFVGRMNTQLGLYFKAISLKGPISKGMPALISPEDTSLVTEASKAIQKLNMELKTTKDLAEAGLISDPIIRSKNAYSDFINTIIAGTSESRQEIILLENQVNEMIKTFEKDPRLKGLDFWAPAENIEETLSGIPGEYDEIAEAAVKAGEAGSKVSKKNIKDFIEVRNKLIDARKEFAAFQQIDISPFMQQFKEFANLEKLISVRSLFGDMIFKSLEDLSKLQSEAEKATVDFNKQIELLGAEHYVELAQMQEDNIKGVIAAQEKELAIKLKYGLEGLRQAEIIRRRDKDNELAAQLAKSMIWLGIPGPMKAPVITYEPGALENITLQRELFEKILAAEKESLIKETLREHVVNKINADFKIQTDYINDLNDRASKLRDILFDVLTDFERISSTRGGSILRDALSKMGREFQKRQFEQFLRSVISADIARYILPDKRDFLDLVRDAQPIIYNAGYEGLIKGGTEAGKIIEGYIRKSLVELGDLIAHEIRLQKGSPAEEDTEKVFPQTSDTAEVFSSLNTISNNTKNTVDALNSLNKTSGISINKSEEIRDAIDALDVSLSKQMPAIPVPINALANSMRNITKSLEPREVEVLPVTLEDDAKTRKEIERSSEAIRRGFESIPPNTISAPEFKISEDFARIKEEDVLQIVRAIERGFSSIDISGFQGTPIINLTNNMKRTVGAFDLSEKPRVVDNVTRKDISEVIEAIEENTGSDENNADNIIGAFNLGSKRRASDITKKDLSGIINAVNGVAALLSITLPAIGASMGRDAGKIQTYAATGATIGNIVSRMFGKSLGPWGLTLGSIAGIVGGIAGLLGSKKEDDEKAQEEQIQTLNMIEQHTAKLEDLAEKMINIPGTVFIPPVGGFIMTNNINVNAGTNASADDIANRVAAAIRKEYTIGFRSTGLRGNVLT